MTRPAEEGQRPLPHGRSGPGVVSLRPRVVMECVLGARPRLEHDVGPRLPQGADERREGVVHPRVVLGVHRIDRAADARDVGWFRADPIEEHRPLRRPASDESPSHLPAETEAEDADRAMALHHPIVHSDKVLLVRLDGHRPRREGRVIGCHRRSPHPGQEVRGDHEVPGLCERQGHIVHVGLEPTVLVDHEQRHPRRLVRADDDAVQGHACSREPRRLDLHRASSVPDRRTPTP